MLEAATLSDSRAASASEHLELLLNARHSCRAFKSQPVPRAVTERILNLAQRTASWTNAQPWQVHVLNGAATDRFRELMLAAARDASAASDFPWPRAYEGIYQARRRECGFGLYASVGIAKGDREGSARQALENFRFFGAPPMSLSSPRTRRSTSTARWIAEPTSPTSCSPRRAKAWRRLHRLHWPHAHR